MRVNSDGTAFSGGKQTPLLRTDLLWTDDDAIAPRVWKMARTGAVEDDDLWLIAPEGHQILGGGDFNGDGAGDVAWRWGNEIHVTLISPEQNSVRTAIGGRPEKQGEVAADTQLAGIGDFNGDGRSDLLWRHGDRTLDLWFAGEKGNAARPTWSNGLPAADQPVEPVGDGWAVKGVADFNGDGYSDILWWHDATLRMDIWYMRHAIRIGNAYMGGLVIDTGWKIQAAGDLDADGRADLLWRHDTAAWLSVWFTGRYEVGQAGPTWMNNGYASGLDWKVQGVADFNGDGHADILWRHDTGPVGIWFMNGGVWIGATPQLLMHPSWRIAGHLPAAAPRLDSSPAP